MYFTPCCGAALAGAPEIAGAEAPDLATYDEVEAEEWDSAMEYISRAAMNIL